LLLVNAAARRPQQTIFMSVAERDIENHVLVVVAEKFPAGARAVTPRTDFRRDLGADSLAQVVLLLESEFQVDIPDEEIEEIATVQQVIDYLLGESQMKDFFLRLPR
jgi:acyl carrier protein